VKRSGSAGFKPKVTASKGKAPAGRRGPTPPKRGRDGSRGGHRS